MTTKSTIKANTKGKMTRFTELRCWQKCREVRLLFNKLICKFPKEEKYRLQDQIIRASRSTTNNIAEGFGRFHYQENIQFCRQSRGSLYELTDHIIIAYEEKYCTKEESVQIQDVITSAIKELNGYINYLKKAKKNS